MKTTKYYNGPFLVAALVTIGLMFASAAAKAEVVDLANGNTGTITGVPGGTARFDFMIQQPTGTGIIQPFLRVQAFPQEEGYNTSGGTPFDDKAGPWTHDITMADLAATTVNIDGVAYFKLLLDANEPNGRKSRISLDQMQFYTSPVCSQTTMNVATLGTLRFSFKPGDYVLLDAARNHGSGSGDMYAFIPVSAFAGASPTDCVYMYVHFGNNGNADLISGGGFEEWALVLNTQPTPTPTPTPTPPDRPTICEAIAAFADPCFPYFGTGCFSDYALWLPGADGQYFPPPCDPNYANPGTDGFRYVFSPPGTFTENANNTATLTGHVESTIHPGYGWDINFTFTGYTTTAPCSTMPMLELEPSCYVPPYGTGGPVDPATWHYYTTFTGTLTGTGNYAGGQLTVTSFMNCPQVGDGASGKNIDYGASGWFEWEVVSQPTNPAFHLKSSTTAGRHGDINFNCVGGQPRPAATPTPTPTPTPKGKKR